MRCANSEALRSEELRIEAIETAQEQFKASQENNIAELERLTKEMKEADEQLEKLIDISNGLHESIKAIEEEIVCFGEDYDGYDFSDIANEMIEEV